jgi:Cohesin domain
VGSAPEQTFSVTAPTIAAAPNKEIVIPVTSADLANKGIISYEFDLRYDPTVIMPLAKAIELKGTSSSKLSVAANPTEPGILRVAVYGALPITEDGILFNLKFTAVGEPGALSALTWERFIFNDDTIQTIAENGQIKIEE